MIHCEVLVTAKPYNAQHLEVWGTDDLKRECIQEQPCDPSQGICNLQQQPDSHPHEVYEQAASLQNAPPALPSNEKTWLSDCYIQCLAGRRGHSPVTSRRCMLSTVAYFKNAP